MDKRKVIQIAVVTDPDGDQLYALCDDGTVWSRWMVGTHDWMRVEDVPQPEAPCPA